MNGGKKARNGGKSVHPKMGVGLGWRLRSTPQAAGETPAIPCGLSPNLRYTRCQGHRELFDSNGLSANSRKRRALSTELHGG